MAEDKEDRGTVEKEADFTDILIRVRMAPPGQAYRRYIWCHYQT